MIQKHGLADWQFRLISKPHNIDIFLFIPNIGNSGKTVNEEMKQLGYFESISIPIKDVFGQEWMQIQFEPLFQNSETQEIINKGDLFHVTPSYNLPSIAKEGFIPKSENSLFKYPNRVYLFIGDTPFNEIKRVVFLLREYNKHPKNEGNYSLLSIDVNKLPDNISFYHDVNSNYGVFTEVKIPVNTISIYGSIKL